MRTHPPRLLAPFVLAFAPALSQAQIVDELDIRRDGANAVLQVRFATEVQFQRAITTRSGDLTLVSYQLLSTTNARLQRNNQVLRLRAAQGLPDIEISDEPDRGEQARRLVVRFAEPTTATVRAGRGNRSIEIVLPGKGAGISPPQAAATRPRPAPAAAPSVALAPPAPAPAPAPSPTPSPVTPPPSARPSTAPTAPPPAPTTAPAPTPGSAPVIAAAPAPAPRPAPAPTLQGTPELEAKAGALLKQAREAFDAKRYASAIEALNQLLELPPTSFTRDAQELAGRAHLANGDPARARAEFETYLSLFPQGEGADRVRAELAALPKPAASPPAAAAVAAAPRAEREVSIAGSASMTFYGGNGQVRSRDFQDSPIAGLPQVAGDPQLSSDHSRQLFNDVDLTWRRRNAEVDQRFVFRDSYTTDLIRSDKSKNRLTALYFDHKSLTDGYQVRLGRQSPTGGGVMSRFDGVTGWVTPKPRIKLGAVVGTPTEKFFQSSRHFYGVSAEADRLLGNLGGGVYAIEQRIDSQIDRRAIGLDLRYFQGGASVFAQFDYDVLVKGLNIATVQATWILPDNTVLNALYDRRALTTLALGNSLTFEDPARPGVLFTRIQDKLATTTLQALREQIKRITPTITQAQIGVTKPWSKTWQTAASLQLTNTGAIPPVPEVAGFENGRPATGDIVTTSAQLIGLNLYSSRDTHVWSASAIRSPTLHGELLGYNNSSFVAEVWQFEPSLQFYRDRSDTGTRTRRLTPGLRITYRGWQRWALESNLTVEIGRASRQTPDPAGTGAIITTEESTHRINYSLGARYEF